MSIGCVKLACVLVFVFFYFDTCFVKTSRFVFFKPQAAEKAEIVSLIFLADSKRNPDCNFTLFPFSTVYTL